MSEEEAWSPSQDRRGGQGAGGAGVGRGGEVWLGELRRTDRGPEGGVGWEAYRSPGL